MKQITINAMYQIISGACANMQGKAISFDSQEDELWLQMDQFTTVIVTSENVVEEE